MIQPIIRVLIVDDSAVSRQALAMILEKDPSIQVIDEAADGKTAVRLAQQKKPDLIIMDIIMPGMDGFEATRIIMETHPVPILIISGLVDPKEVKVLFKAMEAGALACMRKPPAPGHPQFEKEVRELIQTVKNLAGVSVVRRIPKEPPGEVSPSPSCLEKARLSRIQLIAIGVSTGGPSILNEILSKLPRTFPVPIVIVQHIASGFHEGFTEWLAQSSGYPVRLASDHEFLVPGTAYVAPDVFQMGVLQDLRVTLANAPPENGLRPSVSYLFRSLASLPGGDVVAVILSGMGNDGAKELKVLRDKGAMTIAQDEKTSVVYGMPGEAVKLNAAESILTPQQIVGLFMRIANSRGDIKNEQR